jgi:hypothetical protein
MTDARVTQTAVEEWAAPNPQARATQIGAEVWTSVPTVNPSAVLTQIAVEEWARPPAVAGPTGGQYAVTINTS